MLTAAVKGMLSTFESAKNESVEKIGLSMAHVIPQITFVLPYMKSYGWAGTQLVAMR